MPRLRVSVLDPGHFHAALSLRESHPGLEDDVHVYAPEGPGLAAFQAMLESFNRRASHPTRWRLHHHNATDPLSRVVQDRAGGLVILAGKNHSKMEAIERLNAAGYLIFADKPWVTTERALPALQRALGPDRPPTTDIMTSRFEPTSLLLRAFLDAPEVFGTPQDDGGAPALSFESVHQLYKVVNGSVLQRPSWYFDVGTQGEGIVDVTTHLVDLAHWGLFPGQEVRYDRDIKLDTARRWATPVTREHFRAITGQDRFPDAALPEVVNGVLQLFCNGEILYRVKEVPVRVQVVWNIEATPGAADLHRTHARGTLADLVVRQPPEKGHRKEFAIVPKVRRAHAAAAIARVLDALVALPGLVARPEGDEFVIEIPPALLTTHEQHFCAARDSFLGAVAERREPAWHRTNLVTKYTLLAAARTLARQ